MRAPAIAIVCLALVGACDKGQESAPSRSAPVTTDEAALFKKLPAGANVVFGGNYMKVQNLMQSELGEALAGMGPGMKEWSACWVELKDLKLAGSASFGAGGGQMQTVFTGATLDDMKKCADRAGYKSTLDADGKYLLIEMTTMGQKLEQGMLQLPGNMIYTRQSMSFGGGAVVVPGSRAELEGDMAKLAQGTVLDNKALAASVEKVDRTRTFWFAGTAAGTSISDKVGRFHGTFDIASGVAMDVTVQVVDSNISNQIMETLPQLKKSAASMPAELRPMLENLSVARDGDQIHAKLKLTDSQVATLMKQLSAFGRAGAL
ncbi:MAG: hypothetical protein HOV81_30235 [Kofleriaceae bacterium]|nr:hypothetical protein [Kofleriaceae bacterium]